MGASKRREYAPAEVDTALTVLAYYGGNADRAGAELDIPATTLKDWRNNKHRTRYLELAEQEGPRLEALAAHQAREAILRSSHVEHRIFDLLDAATNPDHEAFKPKDIAELTGALQRATTSKGINTTKLLELTGRPTSVVQHLDPKQGAESLARRLGVTIDSTAEEIPQPRQLSSESVGANAREPIAD